MTPICSSWRRREWSPPRASRRERLLKPPTQVELDSSRAGAYRQPAATRFASGFTAVNFAPATRQVASPPPLPSRRTETSQAVPEVLTDVAPRRGVVSLQGPLNLATTFSTRARAVNRLTPPRA